ncbi:hypothetical protein HPP92_004055 [Vanilla planifolia]|uniref:Uncharacterized protein n=1 Tax=Vanilla planifolia TaxID=51239 RepID=A0A835S7D3_VANPL|nr:hypothetical protein HPP92_004055 [Vanilla planifolia]
MSPYTPPCLSAGTMAGARQSANTELLASSLLHPEWQFQSSTFQSSKEGRAATMARINDACEQWGFFQLLNHGIPLDLLDRMKRVCDKCFKMAREGALRIPSQFGLFNELIDGGETGKRLDDVDWEDVFFCKTITNGLPLPLDFKKTMTEYRAELKKLAEKVMEVMDENLGLEKGNIKRAFSGGRDGNHRPFFGTKVSHYPPCPRPELVGGLRAHTDAGAIVINTGDQIEVLSNGRYRSAWHRVVTSVNGNRCSVASFYNPALEAVIEPPEGPSTVYPSFVFGDYMAVYAKQKFMAKEPRFQAAAAIRSRATNCYI